jgi:hypothetical protein
MFNFQKRISLFICLIYVPGELFNILLDIKVGWIINFNIKSCLNSKTMNLNFKLESILETKLIILENSQTC